MTLAARTVDGAAIRLEKTAIEELRGSLRGSLLLAGDPGYEESRTVWNAMIDRHPALIVRCLGVADVVAAVGFAKDHRLSISMKGGGHNIAGLAVPEGGIMLDMSLRRGVWVDPQGRTAMAQAGCILGDVDRETQLHGLAACLGFVSKTGIAGLTLGGGFGYLTRRFGWTCDTVLSMEVVTADGRVVRASEKENPDLFWALRGGGGNFGVLTQIEYRLEPVGPEIFGGAIAWRGEEAAEVLEVYRKVMDEAPPEFMCAAVLRPAPPAPWLPPEVHGELIIALFVCHTGPLDEAEKAVAPLKAFGSPLGDIVQRRSYISQQSILDATQPTGRRYYWKSEYLPGHDPEMLGRVIDHARKFQSPHSAIVLFPLDGALNRLPQDHSPMGNRDARSVFNVTASWEDPGDDEANLSWARAAWEDLRRFSTGGTYVNFLNESEGDDGMEAVYGANFERLIQAKTKWDPTNLFRRNKNIQPRKKP